MSRLFGLRRARTGLVAATAAVAAVFATAVIDAAAKTIQFAQQGGAIVPSDANGHAFFGVAVALSADGNTALIGGRQDSSSAGAGWVFTRSGSTWTQQATLRPSDESGAGLFGSSVALSADGNEALIGAPLDHQPLAATTGAVWVFVRSGSTWSQEGSKLTPSDETGQGYFGGSVALSSDGTTALIGGLNDHSANGAGWVFVRAGSTWTQQGSKLTPNDADGAANFGSGVGLSSDGNTALVGGIEDAGGVGAAWVFTRAGTTWSQQGSKLTASDETGHGEFGDQVSVSGDGNSAVIGAPLDNSNAGAAWIFARAGQTWSQQGAKLRPNDDNGQPQFGSAVAMSSDGSAALIGGPSHAAAGEQGAAWVFTPSSGTWTQNGSRLLESGTSGETLFGASAALSADASVALIGGPSTDVNNGAAWVFGSNPPALRSTSTTLDCGSAVPVGQAVTCTATVTDTDAAPATVPSGTVTFSTSGAGSFGGGGACSPAPAAASASGSCTVTYTRSDGAGQTLTAHYLGDGTHSISTGTVSLSDLRRPTSTELSCSPVPVAQKQTTTCAATVADTSGGGPTTPAGTLTFASSVAEAFPYGFFTGSACTLRPTATAGVSACGVFYKPENFGALTISASYPGDSTHAASSASESIQAKQVPHTTITSGPTGKTPSAPHFTYTSDVPGSTFECDYDGGPLHACDPAGDVNFGLPYGPHFFEVYAIAPDGTVDPRGDRRAFDLEPQTRDYSCTVDANIAVPQGSQYGATECDLYGTCPAYSRCQIVQQRVTTMNVGRGVGFVVLAACALPLPGGDQLKVCEVLDPPERITWDTCYFPSTVAGAVCPITMGYNNPFEPPVTRFGAACVVVQEYNLPGSGMVTCTVSLQIVPVSEFVVAGGAGGGAGVFLPGAGAVVVKAAGGLPEADVARGGRKGKPPFAPLYRKVTGAGWLAFRLKLSPSTKAALRRRHKLTLPIVLTFTPRGGKPVVRRQRLTLTLPPCTRITIPKRTHGHRPQHPVLPAPHSCMPRL